MAKRFQSELERLKGVMIAVTHGEQPLVMGLSYKQTPSREKLFAWAFWTAIAIDYGAASLLLWWVATRT